MTDSRISVITPSFNQGDFLGAAIGSVITQDYPNLEYIETFEQRQILVGDDFLPKFFTEHC